ncbi:hypothetical protein U9Z34_24750, partial [Escherichia coli]
TTHNSTLPQPHTSGLLRPLPGTIYHNPLIERTLKAIHPAPESESHAWFLFAQFLFYFFE